MRKMLSKAIIVSVAASFSVSQAISQEAEPDEMAYKLLTFNECPLSRSKVSHQLDIEIAALPNVKQGQEDSDKLLEFFVPIVVAVAIEVAVFLSKKLVESYLDHKTISGNKQVWNETFLNRSDGYFVILESGDFFAPLLQSCLVVLRGNFGDKKQHKLSRFWNDNDKLLKETFKLQNRPNFYAEFLPVFSPDLTAFRLVPQAVFYHKEVKGKDTEAMSVALEIRSTDRTANSFGGILFPKKSISNINEPNTDPLDPLSYQPIDSKREWIPVLPPSTPTTAKIAKAKSDWAVVGDFVAKHGKLMSFSDQQIKVHQEAELTEKNAVFLALIREQADQIRKTGSSPDRTVDLRQLSEELQEKQRDLVIVAAKIERLKALYLEFGNVQIDRVSLGLIDAQANENEAKTPVLDELNQQLIARTHVNQSINRLETEINNAKIAKSAARRALTAIGSIEDITGIEYKFDSDVSLSEFRNMLNKRKLYQPYILVGAVTESKKLSKLESLFRSFLAEKGDDVLDSVAKTVSTNLSAQKRIENLKLDNDIGYKILALQDAQQRYAEAIANDESDAGLRKIKLEIEKLEGEIRLLSLQRG